MDPVKMRAATHDDFEGVGDMCKEFHLAHSRTTFQRVPGGWLAVTIIQSSAASTFIPFPRKNFEVE